MLLPRPIRKFIAVFRGGVSPLIIVLSTILGFTFGLTPGFYGIHVLILLLFVLLNIHFGVFFLSGALGKGLCFAAAPILYQTGRFVHSHLSGVLDVLGQTPIAGLTDFNRYSVAGALVAGPVAGLVTGLLLAKGVMAFRRAWRRLEANSETLQAWTRKPWVRVLDFILIGKRAKDAEAALLAKSPIIRKAGIVLVVVVLSIAGGLAAIFKDAVITRNAAAALTRMNGAEVNVEQISMSLAGGQLGAANVQMTDPQKPEFNHVFVGQLAATADMYSLLCGRVVIDEMLLSEVRFDSERQSPGMVLSREKPEPEPFNPERYRVILQDLGKLDTYFENVKKAKELFEKIRPYLPKPSDEKPEPEQIPHTILEYLQARSVTAPTPRILTKRIVLDRVELPGTPFGRCKIILTNFSDAPAAAGLPARIEIASQDNAGAFTMTVHFDSTDNVSPIEGTFQEIDLGRFQSQMSDKNPVIFKSGAASGGFRGTATSEEVDVNITVNLQDMKAEGGPRGMLGLDNRHTSEVLAALNNLETSLRLVGPPSDLRVAFDTKGLTGEFQKALVAAGKDRLNQEIQKQIDGRLGDKVNDVLPTDVKEVIKDPAGAIKGIGDLLGGKKK